MMNPRVIFACILSILALGGCKEVLYGRLSEQQANETLAVLSEAGIASSKSKVDDNIWQILVEENKIGEAATILRNQGLPREKHVTMGELFKKDGMIPSPTEERIRYVYSLSEELGVTIKKIPGVIDARVHVVVPKNDPLANHITPSSASIFIKHHSDTNMGALGPSVKDLVVASVEGLEHKNVALFAFPMQSPVTVVPEKKSALSSGFTLPMQSLAATIPERKSALSPAANPNALESVGFLIGGLAVAGLLATRKKSASSKTVPTAVGAPSDAPPSETDRSKSKSRWSRVFARRK
jgi:type III secretion system YscJ/HrcJ family lipoprotein